MVHESPNYGNACQDVGGYTLGVGEFTLINAGWEGTDPICGYTVVNGVTVQTGQIFYQSIREINNPTNIHPNIPENQYNSLVGFVYIPPTSSQSCLTPIVDVLGSHSCNSTLISGNLTNANSGTVYAYLSDGTLLGSGTVESNGSYSGIFGINVDLFNYGGLTGYVVLKDGNTILSNTDVFGITDDGCVTIEYPVLDEYELCKTKCDYQIEITGTAGFDGDVVMFESPVKDDSKPVAVGISSGGVWSIKTSNVVHAKKYVFYGIRYDGQPMVDANIVVNPFDNCIATCVLVGKFKGTVNGVDNGIIRVFNALDFTTPVAAAPIINEKFDVKSDSLISGVDYVLYATKLTKI
jgi:hypothetical protein